MHNTNRERGLRDNGSNANTKICFEVRAPSSTSPPSPRRISNPLSCPPREPPPRRICTTGSTELLSQTPPHNRGVGRSQTTTNHLYRRGIQTKLHLSLEEANQQSQPLPKREQPNNERVYNLEASTISNNFFFHKTKILIE